VQPEFDQIEGADRQLGTGSLHSWSLESPCADGSRRAGEHHRFPV